MIKKYSLMALQTAMNHALSLDDSMPEKLERLHGKVLEMIITPLNVVFFIRFEHTQVQLLSAYAGTPNTIIHTSPVGLIRLSLLPASKVRSLFNDKIRLAGDVELGQQMKQLFDELDIDWEGHLAHFTGDVAAYQLGAMVRRGLAFKRRITSTLQQHVSEYVHEECRLFPPKEELDDFFKDVDDLSLHVERVAAHIHILVESDEIH